MTNRYTINQLNKENGLQARAFYLFCLSPFPHFFARKKEKKKRKTGQRLRYTHKRF